MAVWHLRAALTAALLLGPGYVSGASTEQAVEMFRKGCLEYLPDFSGSEGAFKELGFVRFNRDLKGLTLRHKVQGSYVFALLRVPTDDPIDSCALYVHVPMEDDIGPVMADVIAGLSQQSFRREKYENENATSEAFIWRMESRDATVVIMNSSGSLRVITAITGDFAYDREPEN